MQQTGDVGLFVQQERRKKKGLLLPWQTIMIWKPYLENGRMYDAAFLIAKSNPGNFAIRRKDLNL
jgi:hypothetical protein